MWGNVLTNNTINGIFVRVQDQPGSPVNELDVSARFTDSDIVYVISSNLLIDGNPGGPLVNAPAATVLRFAGINGRLAIDPGVIVKLEGSRIETGDRRPVHRRGNAHQSDHLHLVERQHLRGGRHVRHGRQRLDQRRSRAIGPACTSGPPPPPASTTPASTTAAASPRSRAATPISTSSRSARPRCGSPTRCSRTTPPARRSPTRPQRPRLVDAGHDLRPRRAAGDRRQHVHRQLGGGRSASTATR